MKSFSTKIKFPLKQIRPKEVFDEKKIRQKKSSANLLFGEKIFDENAFDHFFFDEMSGNRHGRVQ